MIEVDLYHINNYLRHKTNLITFHKCVGKKKHFYIYSNWWKTKVQIIQPMSGSRYVFIMSRPHPRVDPCTASMVAGLEVRTVRSLWHPSHMSL